MQSTVKHGFAGRKILNAFISDPKGYPTILDRLSADFLDKANLYLQKMINYESIVSVHLLFCARKLRGSCGCRPAFCRTKWQPARRVHVEVPTVGRTWRQRPQDSGLCHLLTSRPLATFSMSLITQRFKTNPQKYANICKYHLWGYLR